MVQDCWVAMSSLPNRRAVPYTVHLVAGWIPKTLCSKGFDVSASAMDSAEATHRPRHRLEN